MIKEKINIPYAGTKERYEKWEGEPIPVIHATKELNQPTLQKISGNEITPKEAVDLDDRALRNKNCPSIVFGRPHSGEFVPKIFWDRVNEEAKKSFTAVDRGTNNIFKSELIPSVGTKISRMIVDPNRGPSMDIENVNKKAIGKVLWYKGMFGEEVYKDGGPEKEEVNDIVERMYLPYYNGMMAIIGTLSDRRESLKDRILVVDGHSFPVNKEFKFIWDNYGIENPKNLPLFIIGNRDGESCDDDITEAFVKSLENNFNLLSEEEKESLLKYSESNEIIGINKYLKGVHNVQFFGHRSEGVNSFQLELNESAYMNDNDDSYFSSTYNQNNLTIIQKLIEKTCLDINPMLKNNNKFSQ